MLQQFVDRERELKFLEEVYREGGFSLVVIYGRRRVGKTELIKKFMEGKKGIYVLLTNESIRENIRYLREEMARVTGKEYYLKLEVDNFYDFFRYLEFGDEKFVIALDEFPYLLELDRGLLSVFQKIMDEILSKRNIMLILSGSSLSMMENDVLGYRSPLYGRRVRAWKLLPFSFRTLYNLFGDIRKAAEIFYVFGNVPYYISLYEPEKSLEENIRDLILKKGAYLYEEPLILLREEFRESRIYRLILKYLSLGYRSLGKLCSVTGMDRGNLSKYLDTLKETGIIEHVLPLGKRRGGIYEISDSFMDFWFRYVYPYRSELEMGHAEEILSRFMGEKNTYFGYKFERLILHLLREGIVPEFRGYTGFTRWWYRDVEIDIVGRKGNKLLLGECKWMDNVDGDKVLQTLRKKARNLRWEGDFEFVIFAKSFRNRPEDVHSYDLKDLEGFMERNE